MTILGQKIREIRIACGMNQAQFADETGVSQGTVSKWERGEQVPETLPMIEISRLGAMHSIKLFDLIRDDRLNEAAGDTSSRVPLSRVAQRGGKPDLAVRGIALGGKEGDGDFQLNGDALQYLERPAGLLNRPNAFAVILRNTSMEPVYKHGWPIFVDPDGRKPVDGEDVLIELHGESEHEPGPAFIKTLVGRRGGQVLLSQYNPPPEGLQFPADRVKQILRVIPYVEVMGLGV